MKKIILTVFAILGSLALLAESPAPAQQKTATPSPSVTPLKFSLWKGLEWPDGKVYGLSIGFPAACPEPSEIVYGVDVSIFSTAPVKGVEVSGLSMSKDSSGVQFGLAGNITEKFGGLQAGIYNEYKNSKGMQFGIINRSTTSNGLQLGILNIMDNGFLPVFPIINFPKSWSCSK